MSQIIKSNDDLVLIRDIRERFYNDSFNINYINEELISLLPSSNDKVLINYEISSSGFIASSFIPRYKKIILCINKVNNWLDNNINDIMNEYNFSDYKLLKSYLFIFLITHEIEHSYQYLMGENIIKAPNIVISKAYKGLFDLFALDDSIIPKLISESRRKLSLLLYKIKENLYLLERNANIESMDLLCRLAILNNDDDIYNIFNEMRNLYLKCGYIRDNMGSIEETYRNILMYDKYKKFCTDINLSDDDKIRYGFNIDDNIREKLFKKIKK